jgi:dUTP pyrophosphatase
VTLINSPGTIDADYRGEIRVPLINHGREPFVIEPGMRIAQLIIAPVARVRVEEVTDVSELGSTDRGEKGFGSTGVR